MRRTIIAAVGTIANWAIYSSPSLPRITESCGGMLRMFTGGIPAVARAAAVQLSHSFAISPSRNFIYSPLTPAGKRRTVLPIRTSQNARRFERRAVRNELRPWRQSSLNASRELLRLAG
jgi:hypothetical protein